MCVLGSDNLAKLGKACLYKPFGKLQKKQQPLRTCRTGIRIRGYWPAPGLAEGVLICPGIFGRPKLEKMAF